MSSTNRFIIVLALKLLIAITTKLVVDNPQVYIYIQNAFYVIQPCIFQTLETTEGLSKIYRDMAAAGHDDDMHSALEGEKSLRDIRFPIKDIPKEAETYPIWRYGVRAKFYGLSSNRNRNDEYRAVLKAYQIKAVS